MLMSRVTTAVLCGALVPAALGAGPRRRPTTSQPMRMIATAYCDHGTTDSGAQTRRGSIAADPRVLPLGSLVRIDSPQPEYSGTYTVLDTGAKIKGRKIDLFVPDCAKAKAFGKRPVMANVVRRGPAKEGSAR